MLSWDAIGALAQLVGSLAVVGSLAYLAVQIRHSTRALLTSSHEAAVNGARDVSKWIVQDPSLMRIADLGFKDPAQLSEDERSRFIYLLYNVLKAYESVHFHHAQGGLDADTWEGMEVVVKSYMLTPGVQAYWRLRKAAFAPRFRRYIDSLETGGALLPVTQDLAKAMTKDGAVERP